MTTKKSYENSTALPATLSGKVFRSAYSPRVRVQWKPQGESKTKQSFKDECDINRIMARYQATGLLDFTQKREARYADVSGLDYQEAANLVAGAQSMFNDLPSTLRERFSNDPAQLLAFLDDQANLQEAIALGLVNPRSSPGEPAAAPVAPQQEAPKGA